MLKYLKLLKKENIDFEKNKKIYFEIIKEVGKKYNAEIYLFGSYLTGDSLAGSDIDVLIVIPNYVDRIKVLLELRNKIKNRKFEFHVIHEKQKNLFLKLIKNYRKLS